MITRPKVFTETLLRLLTQALNNPIIFEFSTILSTSQDNDRARMRSQFGLIKNKATLKCLYRTYHVHVRELKQTKVDLVYRHRTVDHVHVGVGVLSLRDAHTQPLQVDLRCPHSLVAVGLKQKNTRITSQYLTIQFCLQVYMKSNTVFRPNNY